MQDKKLSSPILPKGQNWIIERMQALGYKSDKEGVCFGIAYMAMLATLAKDLKTFIKRLFLIYSIPLDEFAETMHALQKKRIAITQQEKSKTEFIETLTKTEQAILDIVPFFEGIELYQQPHLYLEWFPKNKKPISQDALKSALVFFPKALEKTSITEEPLMTIDSFTGAYYPEDLILYFQSFYSAISKTGLLHQSIALILNSSQHTITIAYINGYWLVTDANQLPPIESKVDPFQEEIASLVLSAFYDEDPFTIFNTTLHGTSETQEVLSKLAETWRAEAGWKKAHTFTKTKCHLTDSNGASLLFIAARNGDIKTVKELLRVENIDINQANANGITPLMAAVQKGHLEIVQVLLQAQDIDPNQADNDGWTPLMTAVNKENLEIVQALLKREDIDPNQPNNDGWTPLILAAQKGNLEIVQALLNAKYIRPNQANKKNGITPLFMAVQNGHLHIVQALLQAKDINPNLANDDGWTPLTLAAKKGNLEIVQALLKAKDIHPNQTNKKNGNTPLLMAVQNGHLEIVQVLLQAQDIDPNQPDNDGWTPLILAAKKGNLKIVQELLRRKDIDPNQVNDDGWSPLMAAAVEGNLEIVQELLKREDVDPNQANNAGLTPLMVAVQNGHLEVVKELLNIKNINPNQANQGDVFPLWIATRDGNLEIVKLLLEHNADITLTLEQTIGVLKMFARSYHVEKAMHDFIAKKTSSLHPSTTISMTPLDIAEVMGHRDIVNCIKEKALSIEQPSTKKTM